MADEKAFLPLTKLHEWEKNPRSVTTEGFERLKRQIKKLGQYKPLLVTKDGTVLGGNMRLKAYRELGMPAAWVSIVDPKSEAEAVEYALSDNDQVGRYDDQLLAELISSFKDEISLTDYSVDLGKSLNLEEVLSRFGGSDYEGAGNFDYPEDLSLAGNLVSKYIEPPFSVLDSRSGRWQERKRWWLNQLGKQGETREEVLGSANLITSINNGTSIFDPVLTELMYVWFCPPHGRILDPFMGGISRPGVAALREFNYTGIEIREAQIKENQEDLKRLKITENVEMILGDCVTELPKLTENYDLVFTCPPYYDLEVYSADSKDASNFKSYAQFMDFYEKVFKECVAHLKDNRFLVVVVTEIRDKKTGEYRGFVADNINLFKKLGLNFYNDAVLLNALGTAQIRANNAFKNRKLVRTHQNVLVFYKGDLKNIGQEFTLPLQVSGAEPSFNDAELQKKVLGVDGRAS